MGLGALLRLLIAIVRFVVWVWMVLRALRDILD